MYNAIVESSVSGVLVSCLCDGAAQFFVVFLSANNLTSYLHGS